MYATRPAPGAVGADAALAVRFATEFLSWDEDDPWLRERILAGYLPPGTGGRLGWNGFGRQRAEMAVVGSVTTVGATRWFDVNVRVLVYSRVDGHPPLPRPSLFPPAGHPSLPSAAPPPFAPRWAAGPSHWLQFWVPVVQVAAGEFAVDPAITRI